MEKTIYIPLDIEELGKQYLTDRGYKIVIAKDVDKATLIKDVALCDAILTRSNAMIDADVIEAGKNIKVIAKYGVGVNNIDVDTATKKGIYVTNTPEANANAVAEFVMAFILTLSKDLILLDKQLKKGDFDIRTKVFGGDLEGETLGIVGLGQIGKNVASKAHFGFNMNVIGYDPYAKESPSFIEKIDTLEDVLKQSDYISLHLPLLESTKHIIGADEFKLMKKTAYLINASRGGIVEEAALLKALRNNDIAGAGIDVFEVEPPEPNDELFSLDNIITTPHSAALSKQGTNKMSLHAAMQIDQVLCGKKPSWPVNNISTVSLIK